MVDVLLHMYEYGTLKPIEGNGVRGRMEGMNKTSI
jgi:hypothetical protein